MCITEIIFSAEAEGHEYFYLMRYMSLGERKAATHSPGGLWGSNDNNNSESSDVAELQMSPRPLPGDGGRGIQFAFSPFSSGLGLIKNLNNCSY